MQGQTHDSPPLSPVLLAGIGLRILPPWTLQPFLDAAMAVICRRHPELAGRLARLDDIVIRVDPVDLPFDFLLRPAPMPKLVAVTKNDHAETPAATVRGPLSTLLTVMEGTHDGDALFFSRDLAFDGDTEVVVMLRNALDGAGIDLMEDLLSVFGPLARPPRFLLGQTAAIFARMEDDLALLRRAVLKPVADRHEAQAAELEELKEKVRDLGRRSGPGKSQRRPRAVGSGPQ